MRNYIFPIIIGLTAFLLAGMAAFLSVTGMGKIFVGWPILIMMSIIEMGKLVAVSVLYRLWNELKWWKYLLIPMTLIIMLLTSAGTYGYLSAAHEKTAVSMRTHGSQMLLEEKKKEALDKKIEFYQGSISRKESRSQSLSDLRSQQENRMDSLYAKNQSRAAKGVQLNIAQTDKEIRLLGEEADSLNHLIETARADITQIDSLIIVSESNNSSGEVMALTYMVRVTGQSLDSVVNAFMMALIFVFDPLAIILLVVFNIALDVSKRKGRLVPEEVGSRSIGIPSSEPLQMDPPATSEETPVSVYGTNENGDFIKSNDVAQEDLNLKSSWSHKREPLPQKELYLSLLFVLFDEGRLNENDNLDPYDRFVERIMDSNITCTEEQVDEFLRYCMRMHVIKIGKTQRVAMKKYIDAVEIISNNIA